MKGLLAGGGAAVVVLAAVTMGQIGRDRMPALDSLPPRAGGRPDVAACERHIATTLPPSSNYRRLSIVQADSGPLTQIAYEREAGISRPAAPARRRRDKLDDTLAELDRIAAMTADLERERASGRELRLRRMAIRYEASSDAGMLAGGTGLCLFRLIDGRLDDPADLRRQAERSTEAMNAALAQLGRAPPADHRSSGCCLP